MQKVRKVSHRRDYVNAINQMCPQMSRMHLLLPRDERDASYPRYMKMRLQNTPCKSPIQVLSEHVTNS
jgi:hypothetical protein